MRRRPVVLAVGVLVLPAIQRPPSDVDTTVSLSGPALLVLLVGLLVLARRRARAREAA